MDKKIFDVNDNESGIDEVFFGGLDNSGIPIKIDDGINYGIGFFETILVLEKPVFLQEHLNRLNHSLETFGIDRIITEKLVYEIIEKLNVKREALKISVTEKNIISSKRPLTYTEEYYKKGAEITVSPIVRSSKSFLAGHKSLNYGDLILSLRKAKKDGFDDCIFLNEKGFLVESTIGNVFIVKDGRLHTPEVENGLLPGIIRDYIIKDFDVVEGDIPIEDLLNCQGAFLTNSLAGVLKIKSIDGNILPEHSIIDDISQKYFMDIGFV